MLYLQLQTKGMGKGQRIKNGMTLLCIAIFLFSYVNSTMFWHGHTVAGNWIVHSHIASKEHRSNQDGTTHTAAQLLLVQTVNQTSFTEDAIVSYEMEPFRKAVEASVPEPICPISLIDAPHATLRGPPSLV